MPPEQKMPKEFTAHRLASLKTYLPRDVLDDYVLLRAQTDESEIWYRLHREDFVALAKYLASDVAQMERRN
jgi:hypothetical protein